MRRVLLNGARKLARFEVVAVAVLISLAVSCYPGEITNVAQTDIIGTTFVKNAAWGSFDTVVVLDTVVHFVPEGSDTVPISREFDQQIINLVKQGYTEYGYTLIDWNDVDPDTREQSYAFIQVTAASTTVYWQWYSGGWWGGWGGWGGWWGPGWGWGYPCCGGVGSTTYNTGSIFIDMLDGRDLVDDTTAKVLWSATINGLLGSSSAGTADRIDRDIEQAFVQSPYLQANQ